MSNKISLELSNRLNFLESSGVELLEAQLKDASAVNDISIVGCIKELGYSVLAESGSSQLHNNFLYDMFSNVDFIDLNEPMIQSDIQLDKTNGVAFVFDFNTSTTQLSVKSVGRIKNIISYFNDNGIPVVVVNIYPAKKMSCQLIEELNVISCWSDFKKWME